MTTNDNQPLGVLALLGNPQPMHALLNLLREQGLQVDTVDGLAKARTSFFGAGGHDCLIIGPDVKPGVAIRVANSLRAVAPELAMATFGPELSNRSVMRTAHLGSLHPSSRAGQGALMRFLNSL